MLLNINSEISYDYDERLWKINTKDIVNKVCKYAKEITITGNDYYKVIEKMEKILNNIYNLKGRAQHWVHYKSHKQNKDWNIRRDF